MCRREKSCNTSEPLANAVAPIVKASVVVRRHGCKGLMKSPSAIAPVHLVRPRPGDRRTASSGRLRHPPGHRPKSTGYQRRDRMRAGWLPTKVKWSVCAEAPGGLHHSAACPKAPARQSEPFEMTAAENGNASTGGREGSKITSIGPTVCRFRLVRMWPPPSARRRLTRGAWPGTSRPSGHPAGWCCRTPS